MSRRATCALCGKRFEAKRDGRRWKAQQSYALVTKKPVPKPRSIIVCTDCFLELAEGEHGA